MPSDKEFEELKGRIVELENQLKQRSVQRDVSSITPEDLQAFAKVRDVVAGNWGEFCGINDCFKCVTSCHGCLTCMQPCVRCIQPCIFECTCGPCSGGHLGGGGVGRFGGLGG